MVRLVGNRIALAFNSQSVFISTKSTYRYISACVFFIFVAASVLEPTPYSIFFPSENTPGEIGRYWLVVRFVAYSAPLIVLLSSAGAYRAFRYALGYLPKAALAYSLIALFSIFWSVNAANTAVQSLLLLVQMLGAACSFILLDQHEKRLRVIFSACAVVLAINYAAVFIYPAALQNIYGEPGNLWRGVYIHKNNAGEMCLYLSIVFLCCIRLGLYPKLSALFLAGSIFFLVETGSKTSIWILVIAVMVWIFSFFFLRSFAGQSNAMRQLFGLVLMASAVLLAILAAVQLLHQGETFSGRTIAWQQALSAISERPFLGYGYLAFWTDQSAHLVFKEAFNWAIPHSHNGYLDMALNVGLVGAAFGVMAMLAPILTRLSGQNRNIQPEALTFSLVLASAYILHNFLESSAFDPRSTETLFIFLAILSSRTAAARPA